MLEHAGEKALLLRSDADLARFEACCGQESAHSLMIFGNERKCLNGQHFGCFTRGR